MIKRLLALLCLCSTMLLQAQITTFPYTQGFENGLDGWTCTDDDGDSYCWSVQSDISYSHSGNQSIVGESYNSSGALSPDNWLISPVINLDNEERQLSWWHKVYNTSYAAEHYAVYVMDVNGVVIDTLYEATLTSADGDWVKNTVELSDYIGQSIRLAFRHYDCYDQWRFYIDDISITSVGTCRRPQRLSIIDITPSEATLSWQTCTGATDYLITMGDDNIWMTTDTIYTITGLSQGTTYSVNVSALCDLDNTSDVSSIVFTTQCESISAFPYTNSFNDASDVICWKTRSNNGNSQWYYSSSKYIYSYLNNRDYDTNWLTLPRVVVPASGNLALCWDIRSSVNGNNSTHYEVVVSADSRWDNSDSEVILFSETLLPVQRPVCRYLSLNDYAGDSIWISFRQTTSVIDTVNTSSSYLYLHKVAFVDNATAAELANRPVAVLSVDAIVNVGYDANANVTILGGSTTGLSYFWGSRMNDNGTATVSSNGNSATISYTSSGTDSVWVVVSNGYGSDTVYQYVSVKNYEPASLPFATGFEYGEDGASGENWWGWGWNDNERWCFGDAVSSSGISSMYISSDGGYSNSYDTTQSYTPCLFRVINFSQPGRYYIGYDWRSMGEVSSSGYAYDYLRVYLAPLGAGGLRNNITNRSLPNGFIPLDGGQALVMQPSFVNHNEIIEIENLGLYALCFYWRNDNSAGTQPPAAIDNIEVFRAECETPQNISFRADGSNIVLTWDNARFASGWIVSVDESVYSVDSSTVTLPNLNLSEGLNVEIRCICGTDTSDAASVTLPARHDRYYVTQSGAGLMDGSTWDNAMGSIQQSMDAAVATRSLYGNSPAVWVAQGTYYGDTTGENAFTMVEGINVYGGFTGNETQLSDRPRNVNGMFVNQTILDGRNERRVLNQSSHFNSLTVWDGFVIRHGNSSSYGGGVYLRGNGRLEQCVVTDNYVNNYGGGVYCNAYSSYDYSIGSYRYKYPQLFNCIITNNVADNYGGGVYSNGDSIVNCLIVGNNAYYGGGIYINNNYISNIDYTTIVNNHAYYGGGIYNRNYNGILQNSILWGNTANNSSSNQSYCYNSFSTLSHCAVEGNIPYYYDGDDNLVLAHSNAGSAIDSNYAFFVNPEGGDFHLAPQSACVDAGDAGTGSISTDLAGNARTYGDAPDMGCYEWNGEAVCLAPYGLTVSNIAQTSAMVSWSTYTSGQEVFRLKYRKLLNDENSSTWQIVDSINSNRYFLSGLETDATYEVQVYPICGEGTGYAATTTFSTTRCGAVDELVFGEDYSYHVSNLPFSYDYPYTYTQELFLSDELPSYPYIISSLALQYFYDDAGTRNVDIYLGHTQTSQFNNPMDFVPSSNLTLVYSGNINPSNDEDEGWVIIPFSTNFNYNGTDNLVVVIDDNSGTNIYGEAYMYSHPTSQNLSMVTFYHLYGECPNIHPDNPYQAGELYTYSYRNNIQFFGTCDTTQTCYSPNLIVENITDSSVSLLWAVDAGVSYELQYKSSNETAYTSLPTIGNNYTLGGLSFNTDYTVRMRQICGDGDTSAWKTLEFTTSVPQFDILYVKENATGNGTSWSNATGDLNWALSTANAVKQTYGTAPVVWVAQGTYYGDTTAENAFTMVDGIHVYGGFSGNGTEHDVNAYPTILDGQNVRRVLYQPNHFDSTTVWSGFTIRNGNSGNGGGAYLRDNGFLALCDIHDNIASYGSGVYTQNRSNNYSSMLIYCKITNNGSNNNTAVSEGAGVYVDKAIVYNCLIANNAARYGAVSVDYDGSYFYNCNIVNNLSTNGADVQVEENAYFYNCIIWGNRNAGSRINGNATLYNCAVEGGYNGSGNVSLSSANNDGGLLNPRFVHPSSGAGVGYYDGDWHLMDSSACINRGRSLNAHTQYPTDLDGSSRVQQGSVDIGCYESPYQEAPRLHHPDGIMYVKEGGTGNGTSWENAMGSLADALQIVPFSDAQQIWVAEGTYTGGITMVEGVNVYGGFVGNEPVNYNLTLRDVSTHRTELSMGSNSNYVLMQTSNFPDSVAVVYDGFHFSDQVYLLSGSTLQNSVVYNTRGEAAIRATGSTIKNVIVRNNRYGIRSLNSTFSNCIITNNGYSGGYSYAVYDYGGSSFHNCNIVNNTNSNYGVYLNSSSSSYINCIIWNNGTSNISGYSNNGTSFTYCAIEGGRTGEGNITLPSGNDDAGGVAFEDPNGNDYHLTAASVCIGTGSNTAVMDSLDLDGNIRIYDSVVDMGVYELQYSLTCPAPRNPRVVSADSTGAVIVWSGETGATYRVKYYSAINPVPVFVTVSDTTITLPNLAQGSYYWRVQRYCSVSDTSLWAKGPSFCTVHPEEPIVEGGSYKIYTAGQLMWIAGVVNGTVTSGTEGIYPTNNTNMTGLKVELMNNIDITGIEWASIGNHESYYRSGYGTYYRSFNGEFDGGGHAVINPCLLDRYANYVGLFGYLGNGSDVHDLGIEGNVTIHGNNYVGGIAGYFRGKLTNSYNKLNVVGNQYVGGLCGYVNYDYDYYYDDDDNRVYSYSGILTNVYNMGNIHGTTYVGGISGLSGMITNAYNRGTIEATSYYAGGIVGYSGTVNNAYNTGNVTGSYSYSAINYDGSRYNSYYLEGSCANGGGTVLSDYQMQHPTFVSTLNLGQTPASWRSDYNPAINDGYPILNFEEHQFTVNYDYSGSGSLNVKNGSLPISRGDRVADNALLSVTATPSSGYRLASLVAVLGGTDTLQLDALGFDTIRIHSDVNIIATFKPCNAQLNIDYLSASHFITGQTADISWQIRNVGSEATCGANWDDYVVLSTDSASFYMYSDGYYNFNHGDYTTIYYSNRVYDWDYDGYRYPQHPSYLESGQSYTASCTYNVPYNLQYNYRYIFLISGNQYRCIRIERDNSPVADLKVETVVAPANMFAGSQVSVMASVSNIGQNCTSSNVWTDAVYMSFSPTWNADSATLVGTIQHDGHLHVDSSYSVIFTVDVPERYYGTCYFYMVADYNGEIRDVDTTNNVRRSAPVNVFMANPSDLVVQSFTADNEVAVGNCLNYNYQFSNNGPTPLVNKEWQDRVYLVPMQDTTGIIASSTRWNESGYEYYEENYGWHYSDTMPIGATRERDGEICIDRWLFEDNELDTGYYYLYLMLDYQDNIFEYEGESNNLIRLSHPIHLVWNTSQTTQATLVVRNLQLPDTARAGQQVQVEFDIINQSEEIWNGYLSPRCYRYNSYYDEYNSYNNWYEDNATQIAAGDSVHRSYTMTIPPYFSNDTVRFAFSATGSNSSLNSAAAKTVYVTSYGFDLSLTQFNAPATITMGDSITLSWTVQNVSDVPNDSIPMYHGYNCAGWGYNYQYDEYGNEIRTYVYYNDCYNDYSSGFQWYDRIYLSTDSIFSSDDQQLSSVIFSSGYWYYDESTGEEYYISDTLHPNESYNRSVTVAMPYALQGDVWLLMIADGALTAYDANRENNIIARPITINRTPLPDLRIESLTMDTVVKAGNSYTLTYTVSNVGEAATPIVGWTDAFYIGSNYSRSNATQLRTKAHNTTLGVNESYTDTVIVTIPSNYNPGYYFIIAQTDADYYYYDTNYYYRNGTIYDWWVDEHHVDSRVFEFDMESNNLLAMPIQVARPDAVDLAVFEPQLPPMVQVGGEVTASWRLNNQGDNAIQSTIQELIYLSTDDTMNSNAVYIGSFSSQVTLGIGESETHTYTFRANGIIDGQYHLIVQTDASHTLLDINRSNNTAASLGTMTVNIPTLTLGQAEQTTIDSSSLYYKLVIPQDQAHQNITMQSKAARRNATTGLFVNRSTLAKSSMAQYADQTVYVTDRIVFMTNVPAGTYYIMVQSSSDNVGNSDVTLLASILNFEIVSIEGNRASNTGSTTVEIRGSQFDTVMDFRLVKEGVKIPAEKVTFVNSTKVYATFNLTDQSEGVYSLEAELPGGAITTKENCFTVRQSVPAELMLRIYGESAIVVGSTAVFTIEYANMGETDIPIPALLVDGGEHFIALDADSLVNEQKQIIVPIADERGSVRPGESGIITIYVKAASTANLHLKVYGMKTEE